MKDNKRIYDPQELLDLVHKEHSCIVLKHCNRKIELQAKYFNTMMPGIKEALDKGLNKFDYSLNGILLDYQNLKLLVDDWSGRIVGRFGEFVVTVNGEFFVFDPKIGNLLEGVVNAKSNTHVGCLVHKRFNAMIFKPDVEDNWNCENIQIGDKIIFTIVDHVFSGHIPHIEGVLATEYNKKSSKKSKKKSKVCIDHTEKLKENGEFSSEQDAFNEGNVKINKLDQVDLPNLSFKRQQEIQDLTDILEDISPKTKSKRKKNVSIDESIDNLMDNDESVFKVKKKKSKNTEKEKSKGDNIQTDSSFTNLIPQDILASVFSEEITPKNDGDSLQIKKKKKKKEKDKEKKSEKLEFSIQETKKKEEHEKVEDVEAVESDSYKKKKKKKQDKEKHLENVDESVQKLKKKKKRDVECPPGKLVKTIEENEGSPSKRNRLLIEDNIEINVSPVDLIDQLMNVVPTDLILRSEVSPVKETSPKNQKSPKKLKLGEDKKKETPEKTRSPNKKRREESFTENTLKITSVRSLEAASPSKKRRLEDSVMSSKSVHEKSLFSDSEGSAPSPKKPLPNPVMIDVGSSQWKLGVVSDKAESEKVPVKKTKKIKDQSNTDIKKSKKKSDTTKEGGGAGSSIMKLPDDKKERSVSKKSNAANKTVTWNAEGMTSPVTESKTTLLQRFEKCLGREVTNLPSDKTVGTASLTEEVVGKSTDKTKVSLTETKEEKPKSPKDKVKKSETKKQTDKSKDNLELSLHTTMLQSPVTSSTPKAPTKPEDTTGKSPKREPKKTKKPSKNVKDTERLSLINALLEQAKQSLGLSDIFQDSPKTTKQTERPVRDDNQTTITSWLMNSKSKKSPKEKKTSAKDNPDRLGSTDSGFNSNADKHKA